mmetsp:Transcript_2975/g.12010  ORF Transcript_2975/g.12010 Transcript_2975/m.12010 type:complete len:269 (+) Transcript_2975:2198-3004(+)
MVCLTMFCSLRRLPAHGSSTGKVLTGNLPEASSSIENVAGLATRPPRETLCVSQLRRGTAPWLRTMCSCDGVWKPASTSRSSGGSLLNGWRPVRRIMSGWRSTQSSGVPLSLASTPRISLSYATSGLAHLSRWARVGAAPLGLESGSRRRSWWAPSAFLGLPTAYISRPISAAPPAAAPPATIAAIAGWLLCVAGVACLLCRRRRNGRGLLAGACVGVVGVCVWGGAGRLRVRTAGAPAAPRADGRRAVWRVRGGWPTRTRRGGGRGG